MGGSITFLCTKQLSVQDSNDLILHCCFRWLITKLGVGKRETSEWIGVSSSQEVPGWVGGWKQSRCPCHTHVLSRMETQETRRRGGDTTQVGVRPRAWAPRSTLSIEPLVLVCQLCLTVIPTVAPQAPQSMEFSRQEYWSGLPFSSPGDLPNPGIEPKSPALQADSLPSEPPGKL